jgi:hypothetical protein
MRGHMTVNFPAKTQFACSAKVPSATGAVGSQRLAAQSAIQGTPAPRDGSWHLYIFRSGNQR